MANFIIYMLAAALLNSLEANIWESLAMGLLLLAANLNGAILERREKEEYDDSM